MERGAATRAAAVEVVGGWWWLGGRCVGGPWGWKRRGAGGQVAERRRWGMQGQQQEGRGRETSWARGLHSVRTGQKRLQPSSAVERELDKLCDDEGASHVRLAF